MPGTASVAESASASAVERREPLRLDVELTPGRLGQPLER